MLKYRSTAASCDRVGVFVAIVIAVCTKLCVHYGRVLYICCCARNRLMWSYSFSSLLQAFKVAVIIDGRCEDYSGYC